MTNIVLGTMADGELRIDLPVLIESRVLVQAQSGAGKSWALRRLLEYAQNYGANTKLGVKAAASRAVARPPTSVATPAKPITSKSSTSNVSARAAVSNGELTGPESRILNALAWWEAIGVDAPVKGNVGFVAGYRVGKKVGGTFGNLLGQLRSRGFIDYPSSGTASLTDEGRQLAEAPDIMPTTQALHEAVFARLGGPEQRVLQAIIDTYPDAQTKQAAGATAGYQVGPKVGGTFRNILGGLRTLGLIDYPAPNSVVATALLFPEGLT